MSTVVMKLTLPEVVSDGVTAFAWEKECSWKNIGNMVSKYFTDFDSLFAYLISIDMNEASNNITVMPTPVNSIFLLFLIAPQIEIRNAKRNRFPLTKL